MALNAKVTKLDDVDEADRKHYVEKDGAFVLNVVATDGYALEDVGALRSALEEERSEKKKAQKALKGFDGLDPDAVRDALRKAKDLEGLTPEELQKKVAKAREEVKAEYAVREKALADENVKLKGDLRSERLGNSINSAFVKHNVQNGRYLQMDIEKKIEFDDDGKMQIVDGGSVVRGADGKPVDIDGYVQKLSSDKNYSMFFSGVNQGGGGASSGGVPASGTMKRADFDALPPAKQMELMVDVKTGKQSPKVKIVD